MRPSTPATHAGPSATRWPTSWARPPALCRRPAHLLRAALAAGVTATHGRSPASANARSRAAEVSRCYIVLPSPLKNVHLFIFSNNSVKSQPILMLSVAFPKVKWLHVTGEVGKSVTCSCRIFSGLNVPKIMKIG